MTTTPPEAPTGPAAGGGGEPHEGPRVTRDEVRDLGRLRRSVHDRKVAGVAGGLARHLDVDPLVLRVAFVVLAFFGGAGLLLYGACWLLVPDYGSDEAPVTLDERSRTIALLVVGALALFALVGDSWGVIWFPWPVAIIGLVVLLLVNRKDRRGTVPPGSGGASYVPGHDASAGTTPVTASGPATPGSEWGYGQHVTGWAPQQPVGPAAYVRPRDPRKKGPRLFWFTLALGALGVGVLGMVDVAGVPVAASAYAALCVGTVGVMLLVGSVWGRAGGLIMLGLVASLALLATTAADNIEGDGTMRETPVSATDVQDLYEFGAGDLVLDLTEVRDLEELDGRELRLQGGFGEIEVVLPDGVDLELDARVGGPGEIVWFDEERGGIGTRLLRSRDDGDVALDLDIQMGVGSITVTEGD